MTTYSNWDIITLRPNGFNLDVIAPSISGGRNLIGIAYAVNYSAGGAWQLTYNQVELQSPAQHLAWMGASTILNGGTTPMAMLVPVGYINPFPSGAITELPAVDAGSPKIVAAMGEGAALYAPTIKISVVHGTALKAGHLFSINHTTQGWRLYQIRSVISSTDTPTTDTDSIRYDVTIRPPLREETHQAKALEFDWPRCLMSLPPGRSMPWMPTDWWRAAPSPTFIEWFDPGLASASGP
jgi:hypothetical protein